MNETHVAPTTSDKAALGERPARPDLGPASPETASPSPPRRAARPPGWTGGRITALVIGSVLAFVSLGFLSAGGAMLWYDLTRRDAGYVTTGVHEFSTAGSALTTERTDLGSNGIGWLYAPALLDKIRIRVRPHGTDSAVFVGIGPTADVDRYLAGVDHTLITDFWGDRVKPIGGGPVASPPGAQDFWVASADGHGPQTLVWDAANGSWTVVVMNPDGRPGVDVGADLGASMPALPWVGLGGLLVGGVFAFAGVVLIVGAVRRSRTGRSATV